MKRHLAIGDRVRYRSAFLRSISCFTGALPFARGTVQSLKVLSPDLIVATIAWDGEPEDVPPRVNVRNLEPTR